MPMIVNPGTRGRAGSTEANALRVVDMLCEDLGISREAIERATQADTADGWFGFQLGSVSILVPGDDPGEVVEGRPFKSRRLYVDGSSWWYGIALGIIASHMAEAAQA
jgi:hypothetical protein